MLVCNVFEEIYGMRRKMMKSEIGCFGLRCCDIEGDGDGDKRKRELIVFFFLGKEKEIGRKKILLSGS